jgi:hypothetical protein
MDEAEVRRRFTNLSTEDALDRMYRVLCKHTHPDVRGGDGNDFVLLGKIYHEVKRRWREARVPEAAPIDPKHPNPWQTKEFDPLAIIREMGYTTLLADRGYVYLALYRYHSAGLANRRLRQQTSLKRRNEQIINTVYYWAERYDPSLVPLFHAYVEGLVDGFKPTAFLKAGNDSRRHLEEGLAHFIRFQEEGRLVAASLARRSLENAVDTIEVYRLERDTVRDLALWFLAELELPTLKLAGD